MKIRPVEAELFHADRQAGRRTDGHADANSSFLDFCERAWKYTHLNHTW
jgi:hypothetical protein